MKAKNSLLFMLYALCIGVIAGLIIWLFLRIMSLSINFIWNWIPSKFSIPFYAVIVCTIGGLIIGIWRSKKGEVDDLNTVITKVKKDGKYEYKHIKSNIISALLPLIFGSSVGPEAGLTGIIAGLCSWISDKFKKLFKDMKDLTKMGISATLGTIFNSPMFGFMHPTEEEGKLPSKAKIILYFLTIFGSITIFYLLNHIFGKDPTIPTFKGLEMDYNEWLCLIPLSLVGVLMGYYYNFCNKITSKVPLKDHKIIASTLAGFLLGICGTILPYTMFSGEQQIEDIVNKWREIGMLILVITCIVKIFITNVCINMGLKGGHFFPCIFSGICVGYAFSILTDLNPIFCVVVITTSLMAYLLKKPLATILLLMICFPVDSIVIMLLSSVIGSSIKTPRFLEEKAPV